MSGTGRRPVPLTRQEESIMPSPLPPTGAAASTSGFVPLYRKIRALGRQAFRSIRCPQTRDDLTAEAAGLGWQLYLAGVADPADLARRAVALARAGRTVCGTPAGA
jgi:hypothetical protein